MGINIECIEARVSHDQSSSVPGFFLKFLLHGVGCQPNPAPLSVHLHHTQTKVQLQGGALLPDNNRAATWFVEKVLKDRLINEARNKKLDIDNINLKIQDLLSDKEHPLTVTDFCSHCKKKFSNNARPIRCFRCSKLETQNQVHGILSRPSLPA